MSENLSERELQLASAKELRALLLDFIAGGPATAPRYRELRNLLLTGTTPDDAVPVLVKDHEDLNELWQFMKYELPSKVERQELIRQQFDALIDVLDGAPHDEQASFKAVRTEQLLKGWIRLDQQQMEPRRRLSNACSITVQVCASIIDSHYNSAEIRGDNEDLGEVFEMTKDVLFARSAETDKQIIVANIVAGAAALLKAVDDVRDQFSKKRRMAEKTELGLATMAADQALSCAMAMLSCWHMLEDLHSPN